MRKNWCLALLAVSAVLFAGGVQKKIAHEKAKARIPYIAVIPRGTANMWWEVVHKGAQKAAEEENVRISWNGPEVESDREKQIQAVEDAIIKKAQAVVIGPTDFKALARPIEGVHARNLPCVVIDSPVGTDQFDAFVATDNFLGGAEAARILGKALGGEGGVFVVKYIQNSASTDERARGFLETTAKEFPGIRVLSADYTLGSVEDARQKAVDLLTRFPETKGVFAVNHPASVGAYKAVQNQNLEGRVKFVGFDSDPVLLEGIARGGVEAVVAQNPYEIGYRGLKAAAALLRGEKVERNQPVPILIVRKGNLDEMKRLYPQALGL